MPAESKKTLIAFDFDHTIVDGNSDTYIKKLTEGEYPAEIRQLYEANDWTAYMAAIFRYLHSQGVTFEDIKSTVCELPLTSGMTKLFDLLSEERFEVIIISDANTLFINWLLEHHGIKSQVKKVYSNPAFVDENGCLVLDRYHTQDWCSLSSKNMCKGFILEEYIKERKGQGQEFDCIAYVGDGGNDFCPSLRLSKTDYVFPREDYALKRKIDEKSCPLQATVVPWSCASAIKAAIST